MQLVKSQGMAEFTELQKCMIETLSVFHDFCKEYNLTYHLGGGSLLGAIRHQGIIPWDDDIDIDMPRDDYQRLLTLAEKFPKPFEVKHFLRNENYVFPCIKIYNPKIKVTEFYGEKSYTDGAWIDVFPMDGVPKHMKLRRLHFGLVRMLRFLFELKTRGFQRSKKRKSATFYVMAITKPVIFAFLHFLPKVLVFNLMDRTAALKSYRHSEFIGALYSPYGTKASVPKSVYKDTVKHGFNGLQFYIPVGYDLFLKSQYGDYMTPPPPQDRKSHNIEVVCSEK